MVLNRLPNSNLNERAHTLRCTLLTSPTVKLFPMGTRTLVNPRNLPECLYLSLDVKPTRIPTAARGGSFSNDHSPPYEWPRSQSKPCHTSPEQRGPQQGPQRGVLATPSTQTIVELPSHQDILLLNELPPFTSISSMQSFSQHGREPNQIEVPPRSSIDS
jgi:hypothetical protein